jgi:menaquinone-dependent protoporphyrinogen oxidase
MLSTLPVAYFFTCGILAERSEKAENKALSFAGKLEALSDQIKPVSIGRFAGVLNYGKMNLRTRIALKTVFTVMGAHEGDYRDWDAISAWGESVLNLTREPAAPRTPT